MELHAHKLVQLHAWINTESITTACPDYKEYHTVGFNANGSIAEQQQDTNTGDVVSGACLCRCLSDGQGHGQLRQALPAKSPPAPSWPRSTPSERCLLE